MGRQQTKYEIEVTQLGQNNPFFLQCTALKGKTHSEVIKAQTTKH